MNPTDVLLAMLAVAAGSVLPIQFAVNARLGHLLGSPIAASVVSFGSGMILLLALGAALVRTLPPTSALASMPPHLFVVGGLCGAIFVVAAILVTPRLGTAAMAAFAILGQLLAATVIDHFGLLDVAVHRFTPGRLIGALLVVVGAVMVRAL